jgi:hypothetical protein
MTIPRILALGLALATVSTVAFGQQAGKPLVYAIDGKRSVLDVKKQVMNLGLIVSLDWSKVPAPEKKKLAEAIRKDVRLRNCGSLKANKEMSAWFEKTNATTNIAVNDAKGKPVLTTSMVWKNCP